MRPTLLFHTAEDRLGDALIKLPAILALKKQRPDVVLIWSAARHGSAFAGGLKPLVEDVIDELHAPSHIGVNWSELVMRKWTRRFDIVIAADQSLRATLSLRRLRHQCFIAPMGNFRCSDRKPMGAFFEQPIYRQTQQLFELALNQVLPMEASLELPLIYRQTAAGLLADNRRYLGLAPGAGGRDKCWPLERFVTLANEASRHDLLPVFFLGPDETSWLPALKSAVPAALFPEFECIDKARRGPLLTIALAARMHVNVANDSGAGHLLAAGGKPVVFLYGRTNARKFEPPYQKPVVLRAADFGGTTVEAIPLAAVIDVIKRING